MVIYFWCRSLDHFHSVLFLLIPAQKEQGLRNLSSRSGNCIRLTLENRG